MTINNIQIIEANTLISLAKIKNYLKIDHNEENELLGLFCNVAQNYAEEFISSIIFKKKFLIQGITNFLSETIKIELSNLNYIENIKIDANIINDFILIKKDKYFTITNLLGNFEIIAICGSETINPLIEIAILRHISYLYEHRNQNLPISKEEIDQLYFSFKNFRL